MQTKTYPNLFRILFILVFLNFSCFAQSQKSKTKALDSSKFIEKDLSTIQKGFADGSLTSKELVEAYLKRIEALDQNGPQLHSIIKVNPLAIKEAEAMDAERKLGKSRGPLHGIPIVIKDNIDTHDLPTTAGSRALKDSYPLKDSFIVKQLKDAGAIIIGKANLSEWANFRGQLSSSGWSGLGGQTKNPYVLDRTPCGSSSGSAVAVAANLTLLAIGTETDGSIVCPSQTNGIVGIKPTVGLISRSGIIPISETQDTPGPMARSVRDAAICLGALVGIDPADSKTLASKGKYYTDYSPFLKEEGLKGKRIGIYKAPLGSNYKVDALFYQAVEILKNKGATVIELDKITDPSAAGNSFEIMLYEYKDGLNNYFKSLGANAKIKSVEDLIKFNSQDPIEMKHYNQKYLEMAQEKGDLNSSAYIEALTKMKKGTQENGIDKVMNENKLDAIIAPTGGPAWKTDWTNGDSSELGSSSPAAQAGYPNITVPMGFIDELPVGISFFGRAWSEPLLIEIAYGYETATQYRKAPKFLISN